MIPKDQEVTYINSLIWIFHDGEYYLLSCINYTTVQNAVKYTLKLIKRENIFNQHALCLNSI